VSLDDLERYAVECEKLLADIERGKTPTPAKLVRVLMDAAHALRNAQNVLGLEKE
jgi:hypothetical protein